MAEPAGDDAEAATSAVPAERAETPARRVTAAIAASMRPASVRATGTARPRE